jgi:PII-like signaling protein
MLAPGPAKRDTIYTTEAAQHHGRSVYQSVLEYLFYHGVSGATVVRGMAGFGAGHHMHTTRFEVLSADLPVKLEFLESPERVDALLPKLYDLVTSGLIDVQDTTVIKSSRSAESATGAATGPATVLRGRAKMVRIYIGEEDQWHGKPLYRAIVESLRSHDIAGATVYRGILGYGAHRRFHSQHWLTMSRDAPIMISVVDTEEKIRGYLPLLDEMVQEGLVVLSDVDVIKYTHRPNPVTVEEKPS